MSSALPAPKGMPEVGSLQWERATLWFGPVAATRHRGNPGIVERDAAERCRRRPSKRQHSAVSGN